MNFIIQPGYEKYVDKDLVFFQTGPSFKFVIGDVDFLNLHKKPEHKFFIVIESDFINTNSFQDLMPAHIFIKKEIEKSNRPLTLAMQSELLEFEKKSQIQKIKLGIEKKRSELENLNSFLQDQSDEKKMALGEFHAQEQSKKNKEKKLLSFLDYLNSEYEKSDFILEVLKTIWSDLKKIGAFYRLGFVIQNQNHKSYIIEFDGKIDKTKSVFFEKPISHLELNQFLADVLKRPVGKIIHFATENATEKESSQFIFFFEAQGANYNFIDLDTYMSDRISLLSIVVQRWYSESAKLQILKQWQQLFKSYQNPVHVIDENYNLIQSNYNLSSGDSEKKCYQSLALREQPCQNCPAFKNKKSDSSGVKSLVQIKDLDFEIIISEFKIEQKKYFFMIYENSSEVSLLKSNLIQAEKMATIGQLSNHLAHELNNPLTGLKLYAEMLLSDRRLKNPIYENDMQEVLKAISRSQTILQDLNQFANEDQTDLMILDFAEIVKKTMTLLKSILRNHRIFIDLKPAQIFAQPTYLQQVIFNLIKNSCQAMNDKGILKIYQIDNEKYFDFVIEDNGPGLPPQISNQIFKPFFTTKQAGEGTGLGLFISQKLMSRMNAELIFNSNFSHGTQFILRFNK